MTGLSLSSVRGFFVSELHKQRTYLNEPGGSAGRDGHPTEIGQEQPAVTGSVLPANVDRDVIALQPRGRGVPDFAVLARGMPDDLRQQGVMVCPDAGLAEFC